MKVRMFIEKSVTRIQTLISTAALIAALLLLMSGLPVSADVTEGTLGNHRYYFTEYVSGGADFSGIGFDSDTVEADANHPGRGNRPSRSN